MGGDSDLMGPPTPRSVCLLGAGRMGAQIALEYALGGHHVACVSRSRARSARRVEGWAQTLQELELANSEQLSAARGHIAFVAGDSLPLRPDLIIESLPEDEALKVGLLRPLASRFPSAIVASNTSSLSISALGRAIHAGRRTLGTHYLNPPLLMPLVEVIRGQETGREIVLEVSAMLQQLGKQPVVVNSEVAGFVWNRLQFALLREAFSLVRQGIVDADMLEVVIRRGLARRWRATGLFGTVALGGVETFIKAAANIVPTLSDETDLSALREMIAPGPPSGLEHRRNRLLAADLWADRDDHDS